jgi:hypothetical protein
MRRHKGEGNGYIYWRKITKNGKDYPQAYYHWQEKGRKRTKYIPKHLLGDIQQAEAAKRPVKEILLILGISVDPSNLPGDTGNSPTQNNPSKTAISPSNNSPSNLLGDTGNSPTQNNPSKTAISPSNNSPSNLLGDIENNPTQNNPSKTEISPSNNSPSNLLGDIENNPTQNNPSKTEISPSNNSPSNLLGDIENSPTQNNPSKMRRHKGEGSGNIYWRVITKNGKDYPQAYYHFEIWTQGDRLIKSSKYIPKRLLQRVQNLEEQKTPVREILQVLGLSI